MLVEPAGVITAFGAGNPVILMLADALPQLFAAVTVYVPAVEIKILSLMVPVDQLMFPTPVDHKVAVPPGHIPVEDEKAVTVGNGVTKTETVSVDAPHVLVVVTV
jgi:hypothetical protein